MHQRNRRIHDVDSPVPLMHHDPDVDSPVPLMHHDPDRSWITDPDPDHPKGTQP